MLKTISVLEWADDKMTNYLLFMIVEELLGFGLYYTENTHALVINAEDNFEEEEILYDPMNRGPMETKGEQP